jgi:nucleoside-diphosphate-sugar epimerase
MSAILITGADGYIGQAVARWLLQKDLRLILFVRAGDDAERAAKVAALGELASSDRCDIAFGDLRSDLPFGAVDSKQVTGIVHCAAVTNFAVDKATAQSVNVDGTAKLVAFAKICPQLKRFGLVSSIYALGMAEGTAAEGRASADRSFANHYEWSKWQAEALVDAQPGLPWQIYRVATVLGEDESGTVIQQNAIHNTLRLLYYGLLSVIPGLADTRVYTTSGVCVANSIGTLFIDGDDRAVYHVSDSGAAAVTLGEMTDIVYDVFLADAQFAKRRILKPLFCDRETFSTLVEAAGQLGGAVGQSLDSVAPFAPQLYVDKDVQTIRTDAVVGKQQHQDPRDLVRAVASHLVATRWGIREAS